ncbi:LamG-like jellyroll fold domain-containing protein [Alistipes communis]|uniref:LamG-like jellyroll fold domain-containing protein n=1 Tax=Alistipes communis TaxID=2585118 RepID=UPI00242EEE46|nr:LamG-like jellyroll fold domain-containing protein [Alistipes communis]
MANYKIKDLQQAQTLNGAVALEIQDGDSTSTFATLDQIAEFLGNTTPVVLLTKAGPIDDSYLPDMSASEIAAAYDRIVADPIHTVPVVRIPDNGGQYLVPSGYGVHADTKAVIGYYASQTYVLPSSLTLTSETFTLSRLPYTASSMEWADLLNNTALPSGYLGIDSDSTSEEISAAVGGVDAFRKLCSKLLGRNCIVVVSTDPAAANRSASIPVIVDVNRSVGLPLKITLEIEYISSGKYIALTITESGGTFSATRTSVSISDIPDALAGKADLDPATGFVESSQIAPLQGRQTGVNTTDGNFRSAASALLFPGARTIAANFKTGHDVSGTQTVVATSGDIYGMILEFVNGNLVFRCRGAAPRVVTGIEPDTYYSVAGIYDGNEIVVYLNGGRVTSASNFSDDLNLKYLAIGSSFKGIVIGCRLFNYALTASEVVTLWNGGEPERYMLPLSGEMRTGLVAEYIAAGLLADKWRDTSGAGLDLPYVPTATGGTAVLDYQQSLLTPSGSPLHDLFVAAGAVWDDTAKSWTVADYTGIDTPTMTKIYEQSHNVLNGVDWTSKLLYATIPVNLPPRADVTGYNGALTTARSAFAGSTLEKAYIAVNDDTAAGLIDCRNLFRSCSKLKTVVGVILLSDSVAINTEVFAYCPLLERVRIRNLRSSLTFAHSPLLSLESLQYLVENAGNTAAITVTVHADVYAKLTDPSNAEWYAVNAAAQARQIGFAATWGAFVEKDAATVGDLAVYDKTAGAIRFVKGATLSAAQLPESLTPLAVVYARQGDRVLIAQLDKPGIATWAYRYEVALSGFDLAAGGTIVLRIASTYDISITYAAGISIAQLATQIDNTFKTYKILNVTLSAYDRGGWSAEADETDGRVVISSRGYVETWTSIDVVSGATLTRRADDRNYMVSLTGVLLDEGQTIEYIRRKNGVNDRKAGMNFDKFLQSQSVDGTTPTSNIPLGSATIVNQASFETSEFCAELRAAYADYASYLFGEHMAEYPSAYGAMLRDGRTNTAKIGRLQFTDIYGQSKPCYPAAAAALEYGVAVEGATTGLEAGGWWLPSVEELYLFMKDRVLAADDVERDPVNRTLVRLGKAPVYGDTPLWTSCEGSYTHAFMSFRQDGTMYSYIRCIGQYMIFISSL